MYLIIVCAGFGATHHHCLSHIALLFRPPNLANFCDRKTPLFRRFKIAHKPRRSPPSIHLSSIVLITLPQSPYWTSFFASSLTIPHFAMDFSPFNNLVDTQLYDWSYAHFSRGLDSTFLAEPVIDPALPDPAVAMTSTSTPTFADFSQLVKPSTFIYIYIHEAELLTDILRLFRTPYDLHFLDNRRTATGTSSSATLRPDRGLIRWFPPLSGADHLGRLEPLGGLRILSQHQLYRGSCLFRPLPLACRLSTWEPAVYAPWSLDHFLFPSHPV